MEAMIYHVLCSDLQLMTSRSLPLLPSFSEGRAKNESISLSLNFRNCSLGMVATGPKLILDQYCTHWNWTGQAGATMIGIWGRNRCLTCLRRERDL